MLSWFKKKEIVTPAMYEIAIQLQDNAEQIHEAVHKWEHEHDAHIRVHILEPTMRSLFTSRRMIQSRFEMEGAIEELRRVIS